MLFLLSWRGERKEEEEPKAEKGEETSCLEREGVVEVSTEGRRGGADRGWEGVVGGGG